MQRGKTGRGPFRGGAIVILAMLTFGSSGCLDFFVCQPPRVTGHEWTEPGVFDDFPEEGQHGEFEVVFHDDSRGSQVIRKVAQNDFQADSHVSLSATRDDTAHWTWTHPQEESQQETRDKLVWTFESLGLEPPAVEHIEFKWGSSGC